MTVSAPTPQSASKPLTVLLVLEQARGWRWQAWLAQALQADGHAVAVRRVDTREPLPATLRLLMSLEGVLFAAPPDRASHRLDASEIAALPAAEPTARYDLAIDFTDGDETIEANRILRPVFDGVASETAAIAAVLDRHGPRLGIRDSKSGLHDYGTCALEHPDIFTRGLDGVFSRMAGLLLRTARNATQAGVASNPDPSPPLPAAHPLAFLASSLAHKASARLDRLLGQAPRWSVAYRCDAPKHTAFDIPWQAFTTLPDGNRGYYADPFVVQREGTTHVFCEEVPFATGKGIISHFTIGADGKASQPRPVLERPYHLSYPFVFERDGETWMIPESSANRTVELYRAEAFPDRWVKEAVLLDDLLADDATLVEHGGQLWMFASVRDWQASSWEALGLFHADRLRGPWRALEGNPVLLDPAASRPGGALFMHDGQLIRPAQDCRDGYGAGLAFARVDRLDESGFSQTIVGHVAPRTKTARGLHTYNRAGVIEVIDLFGTP